MSQTRNFDLLVEMAERFGGSFSRNLARAYRTADVENRRRIEAAFGDSFQQEFGHFLQLRANALGHDGGAA